MQGAGSDAFSVGVAGRAGRSYVAECIRTFVAETRCISSAANAE
jgi:hypothetical protein